MHTTLRHVLRVSASIAALALFGCVGNYKSVFPVTVVNRTANPIRALANGNAVGEIAAGQTQSFHLTLPESGGNVFNNGVAPTPQADVTITARDARSGVLSTEKNVTLIKDASTTVSFSADDFPSTVATVARFTNSPTNPTINQDVSFNASTSTGSNPTYAWDFGDQTPAGSGVTTTHRYARGGTFTITLTVTSDNRATSSSSRTITVSTTLAATTANFTFSPTTPAINQDVVFTATGGTTTPAPTPGPPPPGFPGPPGGGGGGGGGGVPSPGSNYAWDFGDGTSGTGTTLTHKYTRGGTFTVTLRVTNDSGLTATMSRQITISTTLPAGSASFVFSPTDPHTDDTVYFNASSSSVTGGSFSWDFGDGNRGSGVTTTHVYSSERTYTVTLTVTNSGGQTQTTSKTITVAN